MSLPAGDEIEPLVELGQQSRDLGRIVLQVGVDRDDDVSTRLREPGRERSRLAEVATEPHDPDVVLRVVQAGQRGERAVGRAVVHEYGFPGLVERLEGRLELVEEERHRPLLVVNGDDDRDHGRVSLSASA